MYIRQATLNDLDDMVESHFTAFRDDPDLDYPFPYRRKYSEEYKASMRSMFESYLAESEMYLVSVACSKANEDHTIVKPVAYAIWRLCDPISPSGSTPIATTLKPQNTASGPAQSRLGHPSHPTHTQAWLNETRKARKEYFDDVYENNKIELILLATHEEYQRRGAASKLVRMGMEIAAEHEKAAVVMASASGSKLYSKLGFKPVGKIHIQLEGEEDKMDLSALVYESEGANADREELGR